MTAWLRRAGRGRMADGSSLLWSVAEGRQGRRWRAAVGRGGALLLDLLLEVRPDGTMSRLEVTTAAGFLTLHPEADLRSAHGNVVGADGVRPLAMPWSADHAFEVVGCPIPTVVALSRLGEVVGAGDRGTLPVLRVSGDLAVEPAVLVVRHVSRERWAIGDPARSIIAEIDDAGLPTGLTDDAGWPLEE